MKSGHVRADYDHLAWYCRATGASWANIVERLREFGDWQLKRLAVKSVSQLIPAINAYLENRNEDPTPFVWTKSAQEILTKIYRGLKTQHYTRSFSARAYGRPGGGIPGEAPMRAVTAIRPEQAVGTTGITRAPRHVCTGSLSVLVLLLGACGGDSDSLTAPEEPSVASVIVSAVSDSLLRGESTAFTARAEDSGGNPISGGTFTWASSNSAVATVEGRETDNRIGFVTGVGRGSTTITVTMDGESATAALTVEVLDLASVDAGTFHSCGLTSSGTAYCWGNNHTGILGVGGTTETCASFVGGEVSCSAVPKPVSGGLAFISLSVANGFTCGLTTSSEAYCWGANSTGRLGNGTTVTGATPEAVSGGLTFASLSAGAGHTCGLTPSGDAYCWGANDFGQLGTTSVSETCEDDFVGSIPCSTVPVPVSGDLIFASISAGGVHTCGLTSSGEAYCWGDNVLGQLGNGATVGYNPNPTPFAVSGGLTFASLSTGGPDTCGVTISGTAYCWGSNAQGQLGIGFSDQLPHPTPELVLGGLTFASVSAGVDYMCGVTTNGEAYCWGLDWDGTLGNSTIGDMSAPVPVSGGLTFASVSASWFHTCGLTTSREAYCWGSNFLGQLGIGTINETGDGRRTPVRVLGQP